MTLRHCQSFSFHPDPGSVESQEGKEKGANSRQEEVSDRLKEKKKNGKKERAHSIFTPSWSTLMLSKGEQLPCSSSLSLEEARIPVLARCWEIIHSKAYISPVRKGRPWKAK